MTDPDPGDMATATDAHPAEAAPSRPTFTVTGAAEATGRSRRTIGRLLEAGELTGAHRDATGAWSIPAEALLAAGLQLHAPTPPDADRAVNFQHEMHSQPLDTIQTTLKAPQSSDPSEDHLRAEVVEWRRRAEVAEAIAAERADALADVRAALAMAQRMLPAANIEAPSSPAPPTEFLDTPQPSPAASTGRVARWWRNRR